MQRPPLTHPADGAGAPTEDRSAREDVAIPPLKRGERVVLATHNAGKLAEFAALLAPYGIAVIGAAEAGLEEPEETADSFAGNARLKAEAARDASGLPSLADDSGLVVEGLEGAPGVKSARWAGPDRNFAAAMERVLSGLAAAGHEAPQGRGAAFVTVLALARPCLPTVTFEGRTEGTIADAPRGGAGFGYDPIFVPREGDGRTFAEMAREEKAGAAGAPLSHRARAVLALLSALGMLPGGTAG